MRGTSRASIVELDDDVLGLEVAVDHPALVRVVEPLHRSRSKCSTRAAGSNACSTSTRARLAPVTQLHHHEPRAVRRLADVDHADHVRMTNLAAELRLAIEAARELRVAGPVAVQDFDRERAAELHVRRAIHRAGRAAAELLFDPVTRREDRAEQVVAHRVELGRLLAVGRQVLFGRWSSPPHRESLVGVGRCCYEAVMARHVIEGCLTAIVTPFRGERVDFESLARLVEWQIEQGIDGIGSVGTTGESATLDHDEHVAVIAATVRAAKGRVPVIAGAGGNATSEALALTKAAEDAGADALLHVTPYYSDRSSQEGLYRHFQAIARATKLPVVLYNVPSRTACDLLTETVVRLCDEPNIVAIKDATGNLVRGGELIAKVGQRVWQSCQAMMERRFHSTPSARAA